MRQPGETGTFEGIALNRHNYGTDERRLELIRSEVLAAKNSDDLKRLLILHEKHLPPHERKSLREFWESRNQS